MAEGQVEDGCENISQLVGTCSESPPRDVVWSGCLAGVDVPQDSVPSLMRRLVGGGGLGAHSLWCGWRSRSGCRRC